MSVAVTFHTRTFSTRWDVIVQQESGIMAHMGNIKREEGKYYFTNRTGAAVFAQAKTLESIKKQAKAFYENL